MSSSNSPCAACKCLRRKCTPECIFAPYFPPDKPEKFASVHKVFGASNVSKILNELNPLQREEAVNSLAYEAETRQKDPIYGCVALISMLQQRLKQVHEELRRAKRELSLYMQPNGEHPFMPYNSMPQGQMVIHEPHPQQVLEAQEMMRIAYEQQQLQQQQQQQQMQQVYNNQMMNGGPVVSDLGLGTYENVNYHVQDHFRDMQLQTQEQLLLQGQRSGSDEGPSIGPSS